MSEKKNKSGGSKRVEIKTSPVAGKPQAMITVFFSGMAVMALEISASRLYAPFFGSSIHVWTGLIGSLLFFLAIGNYLGGKLSRSGAGLQLLYRLVIIASIAGAAAPYAARPVMIFFSERAVIGGNMLPGIICTTIAALALPLILFGCVLPIVTGALTSEVADAGRTAGVIYSLSTTGSILGVFLPTLVTLPSMGTRMTFVVFAALPAAASAIGLGMRAYSLLILLLILPAYFSGHIPLKPPLETEARLVEKETLYNYVDMTLDVDTVKMTVDNGWFVYSKTRKGHVLSNTYRDYFALSTLVAEGGKAFPAKICILGLAGGTDARVLHHIFPDAHITGVEIDPELVELGRKYMELGDALDELVVSDGRAYLAATKEKFDLIIVDVYSQAYIPFHMATVEFFEKAAASLSPGGVMAMNVAWRSSREWEFQKICAETIGRVFNNVFIQTFSGKSNSLIMGVMHNVTSAEIMEKKENMENPFIKELVNAPNTMFSKYERGSTTFVMTDNLAPVELFTEMTMRKLFNAQI